MSVIQIVTSEHSQMVDITLKINRLIPADMKNGICHVFSRHTTAGLTINENADPDVCIDILDFLDRQIPWNDSAFHHMEGNSAAHIKSSMMGFAQTIPIENGHLDLGRWQGVYFCEFDGPRKRNVSVSFIRSN